MDEPAPAVPGFLALACTSGVVISALKIALVVGSILALINHGGNILELNLSRGSLLQIVLTTSRLKSLTQLLGRNYLTANSYLEPIPIF